MATTINTDWCVLCMEEVEPDKWHEHMANKHHAVLRPIDLSHTVCAPEQEESSADSPGRGRP